MNLDWKKIDSLLTAGCLGTEVASYFGIHPDTVYKNCQRDKGMGFTEYAQSKRATGEAMIKVAQFDEAVNKRDRGMLIWLGKNRLGQSDKELVEHKGNVPIEIVKFTDKDIKPWKGEKKDGASNTKDSGNK